MHWKSNKTRAWMEELIVNDSHVVICVGGIGGGAYWAGRSQARATFAPNGPRMELARSTFWRKIIFKSKHFFPFLYTVKILAISVIGNALA
jgi:hypothetical protein